MWCNNKVYQCNEYTIYIFLFSYKYHYIYHSLVINSDSTFLLDLIAFQNTGGLICSINSI